MLSQQTENNNSGQLYSIAISLYVEQWTVVFHWTKPVHNNSAQGYSGRNRKCTCVCISLDIHSVFLCMFWLETALTNSDYKECSV